MSRSKHGYFYFNVTHLVHRQITPTEEECRLRNLWKYKYKLTINAEQIEDSALICCCTINLEPPSDVNDPVRALDDRQNVMRFHGKQVPLYVSRWWPTDKLKYQELQPGQTVIDDLEIRAQLSGEKKIYVDLRDRKSQELHTLMEISGDLGHDLFSVEAFRFFDETHLVVRLSFLWVKKRSTFVPGLVKDEAPDLERFDLLLNGNTGEVKYVGRDLHWQEMWGQPPKQGRLAAHIGMSPFDIPKELKQALVV